MPLPPGSSSFPPATPPALKRMVWIDTPYGDGRTGTYRTGPFSASVIPISGGQQVQRQGEILLTSDRIYLPAYVDIRESAVITDAISQRSYSVQFVQHWNDRTEVLVLRESADL